MFSSLAEIVEKCEKEHLEFWEVILQDDMQERRVSHSDSYQKMTDTWEAMNLAAANYDRKMKSASGLIGGDGGKREAY